MGCGCFPAGPRKESLLGRTHGGTISRPAKVGPSSRTVLPPKQRLWLAQAAFVDKRTSSTHTHSVKRFATLLIVCALACAAAAAGVTQTQANPPDSASKAQPDTKDDSTSKQTPKDSPANDDAHRPPPISGTWILPEQRDRGVTFQTKLSFFRSQQDNVYTVHESILCSRGNQSLASQAEAPIKATKHEITILEAASHEAEDGDITCKASISPGTLHYSISADGQKLTLGVAGQSPMELKREEE